MRRFPDCLSSHQSRSETGAAMEEECWTEEGSKSWAVNRRAGHDVTSVAGRDQTGCDVPQVVRKEQAGRDVPSDTRKNRSGRDVPLVVRRSQAARRRRGYAAVPALRTEAAGLQLSDVPVVALDNRAASGRLNG